MKAKTCQREFLKNSLSELMSPSRVGISPTLSGTLSMKKITHFICRNSGNYSKNIAINLGSKGFT